jgi:hypothetical protein
VAGKTAPDIVKPVPVSVALSIVIGTVPVEVKVTDCVAGVFITTSPNATLVALLLSARIAALSCRVKFLITPAALAVIVTACAAATEDTLTVNWALFALAGTVTVFGTTIAGLLLDRFTVIPLLGAEAVIVTVQASVPVPVMEPLLQYNALSEAELVADVPVPLRLITGVSLAEELPAIVSCPVAVPAEAGLNWRFTL